MIWIYTSIKTNVLKRNRPHVIIPWVQISLIFVTSRLVSPHLLYSEQNDFSSRGNCVQRQWSGSQRQLSNYLTALFLNTTYFKHKSGSNSDETGIFSQGENGSSRWLRFSMNRLENDDVHAKKSSQKLSQTHWREPTDVFFVI